MVFQGFKQAAFSRKQVSAGGKGRRMCREGINPMRKVIALSVGFLFTALPVVPQCAYADSERLTNRESGHSYQRIDTPVIWLKAKKVCSEQGGHLATITSEEENRFIFNTLLARHPSPYYFWLGATDEKKEGEWTWITAERWSYVNWAQGEPNNNRYWEHCLAFMDWGPSRPKKVGWNDLPCVEEAFGFICEWEALPGN